MVGEFGSLVSRLVEGWRCGSVAPRRNNPQSVTRRARARTPRFLPPCLSKPRTFVPFVCPLALNAGTRRVPPAVRSISASRGTHAARAKCRSSRGTSGQRSRTCYQVGIVSVSLFDSLPNRFAGDITQASDGQRDGGCYLCPVARRPFRKPLARHRLTFRELSGRIVAGHSLTRALKYRTSAFTPWDGSFAFRLGFNVNTGLFGHRVPRGRGGQAILLTVLLVFFCRFPWIRLARTVGRVQ